MGLRTRIVALAVVPLLVALLLVAAAVYYQERDLAARERALVEHSLLAQRRSELRSYVELAVSTVRPLYDTGRDDEQTRDEALRRTNSPARAAFSNWRGGPEEMMPETIRLVSMTKRIGAIQVPWHLDRQILNVGQ